MLGCYPDKHRRLGRWSLNSSLPSAAAQPREEEDTFLELPQELNQTSEGSGSAGPRLTPRLDVFESDRTIEMTAELPGVAEEDIELNLEGDILTISGEKRDQHQGKKVHFTERSLRDVPALDPAPLRA